MFQKAHRFVAPNGTKFSNYTGFKMTSFILKNKSSKFKQPVGT